MTTHDSPTAQSMAALSMFPEILAELSTRSSDTSNPLRNRLHFVNTSQQSYDEIESGMSEYLKCNLKPEAFEAMHHRVEELNQESRLCELLLEIIKHAEGEMDRHVAMFDDILLTINRVRDAPSDDSNFKVCVNPIDISVINSQSRSPSPDTDVICE